MKIGIDLDGVILDTEIEYRVNAELYDMLTLRKNSLINREEISFSKRYSWNKKEKKGFELEMIKIAREASLMPGAKNVINLLKQDGNTLILVSARGKNDKLMQEIGIQSLKKYDIYLDKYYFGIENKVDICINEKIDVMIDDNYENCLKLSSNNILTLYFADGGMKDIIESKYLKVVYNWGEIYRYIYS